MRSFDGAWDEVSVNRPLVLGALGLLAAAATYVLVRESNATDASRESARTRGADAHEPDRSADTARPPEAAAPEASPAPARSGAAHAAAPSPDEHAEHDEPTHRARRIDRARWELLRRAVERAQQARLRGSVPPGAAPSEDEGAEVEALGAETIQDAMRDLSPLITECYELALVEDPELQEQLTVRFSIAGEPDVGGAVEEASLVDEIESPTMEECVRETIYTLELPAPEEGGRVEVVYRFHVSDVPPEGEDTGAPAEERP